MRKLTILSFIIFACFGFQSSEEFGIASYYSDAFHGRKTASGELYNKDKLTAAHKTLPFGTLIKVTRLDNKTSVIVVVNDRGPYIKGRIVDLSKAAAIKLDLIRDGKARVKIEVLEKGEEELLGTNSSVPNLKSMNSGNRNSNADLLLEEKKANTPSEFTAKSPERILPVETDPQFDTRSADADAESATNHTVSMSTSNAMEPQKIDFAEKGTLVKSSDFKVYDLYKIQLIRPAKGGFGVQVASMSQYENVMKQVAELQENWFNNILVSVEKGKDDNPLYKIILGPFPDRKTAESYKNDLKSKKKIAGFVVDLK